MKKTEVCHPEDHLIYFRFMGRLMGKALFDRQLVKGGRMVKLLYKYILGWPVTFSDLQDVIDEDDYNYLKGFRTTLNSLNEVASPAIADIVSDFLTKSLNNSAVAEEALGLGAKQMGEIVPGFRGMTKTIELVPDGLDVHVTEENLPEYIDAYFKYHMLEKFSPSS